MLTYADVCERRDRLFAAVYMLRSDTNATVAIHAFQVRGLVRFSHRFSHTNATQV